MFSREGKVFLLEGPSGPAESITRILNGSG